MDEIVVVSIVVAMATMASSHDFSTIRLNASDCSSDGHRMIVQLHNRSDVATINDCRSLDVSNNGLRNLDILTSDVNFTYNLLKLNLSANRFERLEDGTFRLFGLLESLRLNDNRLSTLEANAFRGLDRLDSLYLNGNRLTTVDDAAFDGLVSLTVLTMRRNRLTSLPAFSPSLVNLRRLGLDENELEAIDDGALRSLASLEHLDVSDNRIRTMGDRCLDGLDRLTGLRLDGNRLGSEMPADATWNGFNLSVDGLVNLDVSRNDLVEFHASFDVRTTRLQNLNVSRNPRLSRVRLEASSRAAFRLLTLDASHSAIDRLDDDRLFLSRTPYTLRAFYVDHNRIETVRDNYFDRTIHLKLVTLGDNRLTRLSLSESTTKADDPEDDPEGEFVNDQAGSSTLLRIARNPWMCDCHLDWLKTIVHSPGKRRFLVEDYDRIWCNRRFHRFKESLVRLVDTDAKADFLCTFPSSDDNGTSDACPDRCSCYHSSRWDTVIIDCHGSNLTTIPSVLPVNTTVLYLDANELSRLDVDSFDWTTSLPSLQSLFLNDTDLTRVDSGSLPARIVSDVRNLFLQDNRLTWLPEDVFENATSLVQLDLARNRLAALGDRLFVPLDSHLRTLRLDGNNLTVEPIWRTIGSNVTRLAVYDNPWSCECQFAVQLTAWMSNASRRLVDYDRMYCVNESSDRQRVYLNSFDETLCVTGIDTGSTRVLVIATSLAVLAAVVLLAVLVTFVYRREIQVIVYSRYGVRLFHGRRDADDDAKTYDAFVSYSSLDEEFVVRDLLPGLEGIDRPYRLCLHHRDFPIGAFINESIIEAIDDSRRTILLLSANFVRSEWCRFEFRTAHALMLQDRRNRVIVIVLDAVQHKDLFPEMRHYLRTNTYLSWGDAYFWKKLYFVLPERPKTLAPVNDDTQPAAEVVRTIDDVMPSCTNSSSKLSTADT